MNVELLTICHNAVKKSYSGFTKNIYYDFLPDEKLLSELTVVFELKNTANSDTFDRKEMIKTYSFKVKVNAPTIDILKEKSIYMKKNAYGLTSQGVKNVKLVDESDFYDSELEVFTEFFNFEITV